jgi:Zn(II)-responsive transcriptional regulator
MKIGEVAKAAAIGIDAIRFYEREGLIAEPARRPSGYRVYSPDVVLSLRFIRRAKVLGFSLKEIAELLFLETGAEGTAADVKALAEAKLADIEQRIRALQRMRRALRKATESCTGEGPATSCSILQTLNREEREEK